MSVSISDAAGLALLTEYTRLRDEPRNAMAFGVYPNAIIALQRYQALTEWLAQYPDFSQLHQDTVGAVLLHVQTMIDAMETIVATMQAIEAAAPGTFNIELPSNDESGEE